MSIKAFEGIVKKGQIKLKSPVNLPDETRVFVVVPEAEAELTVHLRSPHLAHPDQAADFKMEIIEVSPDAGLR
ncbi:MAG: hypothetical protein LC802_21425 [Acidobacteria bacterium]|nr:hypothetical protein [Acidobacteriota bacterium]